MKNTVTLVGFVGNNPEVRTTQSGASITSISLATSRSFKDGEGNRQTETEWHRITCFNGIGKSVAEHVTKGAIVTGSQKASATVRSRMISLPLPGLHWGAHQHAEAA